jgi:RNA polymerase sigma-70 factor (ECF subfamily)
MLMGGESEERPVMPQDASVTDLLNAWGAGDSTALDELMAVVYPELRASAGKIMARERASHTLQPTALVNETYLRLLKLKKVSWESRIPFFAFSAKLMRRILVEHARTTGAKKRGGEADRLSIESVELSVEEPTIDILTLHEALEKLEAVDPRLARVCELRFFAGCNEEETATALGVGRSSVQRDWVLAKRLLAALLEGPSPETAA